ncbi:unnamed protein product [Paramecium sonneborni]|uniref:Uncharacterized protein n=1 Tax=Paramecium sonneborni TaxID=65129 RepID=A0A8S1L1U3_9CILI|nr:unnamed protein product [Paramecium sonneborni]
MIKNQKLKNIDLKEKNYKIKPMIFKDKWILQIKMTNSRKLFKENILNFIRIKSNQSIKNYKLNLNEQKINQLLQEIQIKQIKLKQNNIFTNFEKKTQQNQTIIKQLQLRKSKSF